jgi:hypothetical protein
VRVAALDMLKKIHHFVFTVEIIINMARTVFINKTGKLEIKPDDSEIAISDSGVTYLVRDADSDDKERGHMAYKLHNVGKKWYWLGLWNCIVMTGKEEGYSSMEAAIKGIIKEGYEVEEVTYDGYGLVNPAQG